MSCESRANKGARQAAGANGIGYEAGKSSYEAGRQAETWLYLPGPQVDQSLPLRQAQATGLAPTQSQRTRLVRRLTGPTQSHAQGLAPAER